MTAPALISHAAYAAIMVAPTAYVVGRPACHGPERVAWRMLSVGLTLWTLGYVWQMTVDVLDRQLPFPSGADALWVSSYAPTLVGLGLLIRSRVRRPNLGIARAGLTLGSVLLAVVTAPLLPIVEDNASGLSLPAQITTFVYPVADTVIAAIGVTMVLLLGVRSGRTWVAIAVGALPLVVGDVLWTLHLAQGTWASGMWSNWLFVLWPAMVAVAARPAPDADTPRTVDTSSVRLLIAVLAASLAAIVLLVVNDGLAVPATSVALAAVGLLAAIDRLWAATARGLRASLTAAHDRAVVEDIRDALSDGELEVHLQPLVHARDGTVAGAEALIRWRRPDGLVAPDAFLPAVERSPLIAALTDFVVDRALGELVLLRAGGHELTVSVNLAVPNLADPTLAQRVARALHRHGLPPEALTLELTETATVADRGTAARVLENLHALGIMLSLDDFGTGHSSLVRLARTRVHELKVDRSFLTEMSGNDRRIVATTVELAHALGLRVVAEGVETADALHTVRALGCDLVQGWHVGGAMPGAAFRTWIERWETAGRTACWASPGVAAERAGRAARR
ncbi:MAG TPA: EAL domain-containing protein [Baekduia sp.]|nr:EAL domain-containing protein [Baekduia sp.]